MRRAIACAVVALAALSGAQLTESERAGIAETLFIGNMSLDDLRFARMPMPNPNPIALVDRGIREPLTAADALLALHANTQHAGLGAVLESASSVLDGPTAAGAVSMQRAAGLEQLPPALREPILDMVTAIAWASVEIDGALGALSPAERRLLIESLPGLAVEEELVNFDFVSDPIKDRDRLAALVAKIDLPRIRRAAVRLEAVCAQAIKRLAAADKQGVETIRAKPAGFPIVIAGTDEDEHSATDAILFVDLGGNDTYTGRHGAGVGYASVCVDLSGDDRYEDKDLSIGAGLLGIGLAYDLGGDDVFAGGSLSYGAGLAGVGGFFKQGGDDIYRSVALSLGFGQWGIGACLDSGGDDAYDLALMGQGAARTLGVGWLIDQSGDDEYRAGGLSLNSPLFADAHYSFAQGFGMGYREESGGLGGGVGLLTDHGGDDFYLGETYQQAASYWFSLGSLYDAAGNDAYIGHHYCQASAMHSTGAYLFDLGGADAYAVKVGAAHAIGHDYGVAVMLDRAGDDVYASRDSNPAIGNANGLGLFVDSGGIDRYQGPPGKGNPARGTGSLGVFVDLNGDDLYRVGMLDGGATATQTWGVALDYETVLADTNQVEPPDPVEPGSAAYPGDAEVARIYDLARQWAVGTAADEARENLDKLVAIGEPALEWMLSNRLVGANRFDFRVFQHVVRGLGDAGKRLVGVAALRASNEELAPIIRVAMDASVQDVGTLLGAHIDNPELQELVVRAAGALRSTGSVPGLMRLCMSDDPLLVRAAMVSLGQIADPSSVGTARAMLRSEDMPTRRAALQLIAKFPEEAKSTAEQLLGEADESRVRQGIALLSLVGGEEALNRIASMLLDPRAGVRIEALLALDGRFPTTYAPTLNSLRSDPVEAVRAVAKMVRPE